MNLFFLLFEFSICSFFQNEAPYLKEWIEYHRQIGFEHFWLYNNNSDDNYLEVLQPYIDEGIVELQDHPSPKGEFWASYQVGAFNKAIQKSSGKTTWLAMIDIDEFITPLYGKEHFIQTMREKESIPDLGGLVLFWQIFGTSDLWDIPPGKSLLESLTHRAADSFPMNNIVKTIVRPERVLFYDIHSGIYHPPYRPYTLVGPVEERTISFDNPVHDPIRINHYWVRTLSWYYNIKVPRLKQFNPDHTFDQAESDNLNRLLNEQEDTVILNIRSPDVCVSLGNCTY